MITQEVSDDLNIVNNVGYDIIMYFAQFSETSVFH